MSFSNTSVSIDDLPVVLEGDYIPLELGYLKVIALRNSVISLIFLGGFVVYFLSGVASELGVYRWIPIIVMGIILTAIWVISPMAFRKRAYQIREKDVIYRQGLWWREETVVPFVRIQHSEVTQGPLGRYWGFASLGLFTAGSSRSDLRIPALTHDTAVRLKEFIAQRVADAAS